MIDQLIAAHIADSHPTRPARTPEAEEEFYQRHGSDAFIRIMAWLTSIDMTLKRDRASSARSLKTCSDGCGRQAALRPLA